MRLCKLNTLWTSNYSKNDVCWAASPGELARNAGSQPKPKSTELESAFQQNPQVFISIWESKNYFAMHILILNVL